MMRGLTLRFFLFMCLLVGFTKQKQNKREANIKDSSGKGQEEQEQIQKKGRNDRDQNPRSGRTHTCRCGASGQLSRRRLTENTIREETELTHADAKHQAKRKGGNDRDHSPRADRAHTSRCVAIGQLARRKFWQNITRLFGIV